MLACRRADVALFVGDARMGNPFKYRVEGGASRCEVLEAVALEVVAFRLEDSFRLGMLDVEDWPA